MSAFGTEFCNHFAIAKYEAGAWGDYALSPTEPIPVHPAAHVLHYASTCFEGFKAYRWKDGSINLFRMKDNIARMQRSAESLRLPVPDANQLSAMVMDLVAHHANDVPETPGSLYLRPTLVGTMPNIGAAAAASDQALLFVLASPVGDYFSGGARPLKVLIEESRSRSTEQLGSTKTGGNYAAALGPTLDAKSEFGVDQVLFCPDGDVQETGASNFLLVNDNEIITKPLDSTFLHGITRDSILKIGQDIGYEAVERELTVTELMEKAGSYEAILSGTAACLSPVGTYVYRGKNVPVIDGQAGPNAAKLRQALLDIQWGNEPDNHGWLTRV